MSLETRLTAAFQRVGREIKSVRSALGDKADRWNGAIAHDYLYMSPESGKAIEIPYFQNDIAYNNIRGGAARLYKDGVEQSTNLDVCFEPEAAARSLPVDGVTEYVVEVDLWKTFTYGTKVGLAVMESWRAKYIKIEAWDKGTETWKLCHEDAANPTGDLIVNVPGQTGQGITKLRYTFRDFNSPQSMRIGQLILINYSSDMGAAYFLKRNGGDLLGKTRLLVDPTGSADLVHKKYVDTGLASKADTEDLTRTIVDPDDPDYYLTEVGVADEAVLLGGDGKIRSEYLPAAVPLVDGQVPAQNLPAMFRTTDTQPFRADSIWNTPIGTEAAFEAVNDPATASMLAAAPAINDTLNGYGFYVNIARPTDPIGTGTYTGSDGKPITFTHRIPYDAVISAGTDLSMRVIDGRWAYDYWKTTKIDEVTYRAEFITRTDLLGSGMNTGTRAARWPTAGGLIRSHEVSKCYIPHALCISIPGTSLKRGFVWPAAAEDAAKVVYSGQVPMGSFFAIPPSVDIGALGLSQEGYALAECLQNYGMYVGDQSGSAAISVDGEAAVVMRPALERMRADWTTTLFPLVRRVTNVGTTAGGPGPRRVPASGPVTIRTDYQETMIDVLTARLRVASGTPITTETCSTAVDPVVATDAGRGGRSLPWSGWASQYRIADKALRRAASPDGSTRILLLDPGVRNVRLEGTLVARQTSGWAYLVVAANGSSDHFRFGWTSTGSAQVQRVVGGSMTVVTGSGLPNGTVAAGKRIGVMVYGPNLYVLVDGEVVFETLDTANLTFGQCGLMFPSDTTIAMRDLELNTVPRLFRKPLAA